MFFCNQILESHSWFGTLKIAAKCLDSCSVVEVKIPRQSKAFLSLNGNCNSDDMIMMMEVIIITKRNQRRKAGRKVKNLTSEESYKHRSDLLWSFSFLPDYICKDKASSQSNVIILSWHLELQEAGGKICSVTLTSQVTCRLESRPHGLCPVMHYSKFRC